LSSRASRRSWKQGSWYKNWKSRYFELFRDFVVYYELREGGRTGEGQDRFVRGRRWWRRPAARQLRRLVGHCQPQQQLSSLLGVCDGSPYTSRLNERDFREYRTRNTCIQIRVGDKYIELLSVQERDSWLDAIMTCAASAKAAAEQRA
jgi:hypothetical protein